MSALSNLEILERWIEILNTNAFDKLEEVLHPDYVQEIPQSGERVRGIENMRQVLTNYPGGFQLDRFQRLGVVGSSARYLMTAAFSVVKVEGSDDILGVYMKAHYPDGSDWYYASFLEFTVITRAYMALLPLAHCRSLSSPLAPA